MSPGVACMNDDDSRLSLHGGDTDLDTEYIATYGYISKCVSTYDTHTYTPALVHTIIYICISMYKYAGACMYM